MEPLSILGVVASIVQIIDFTTKLTTGARQAYISGTGAISANEDIKFCAADLQHLCQGLQSSLQADNSNGANSEALRHLAKRCQTISERVLALLHELAAKDPTSKLSCFVSALKTERRKHERDDLLVRLEECRRQVDIQLQRLVSSDIKALHEQLTSLSQVQDKRFDRMIQHIDSLRNNVSTNSLSALAEQQLQQVFQLPELRRKALTGRRILNLLQFEDRHGFYHEISAPQEKTLAWALDQQLALTGSAATVQNRHQIRVVSKASTCQDRQVKPVSDVLQAVSETNNDREISGSRSAVLPEECGHNAEHPNQFVEWLQSGSGIFHITGKSGSGKSTMMKYLCRNPRIHEYLETWAGSRRLCRAKYFLSKYKSRKSRTIGGMCRSLLYDLLEQNPDLIEQTLPELWRQVDAVPWQVKADLSLDDYELRSRLVHLLSNNEDHLFCLFMDGLDLVIGESVDRHGDIINFIKALTLSAQCHLKICVSSDESSAMLYEFRSSPRLIIHAHNSEDIEVMVLNSLRTTPDEKVQEPGGSPQASDHFENSKRSFAREVAHQARGDVRWALNVALAAATRLRHTDISMAQSDQNSGNPMEQHDGNLTFPSLTLPSRGTKDTQLRQALSLGIDEPEATAGACKDPCATDAPLLSPRSDQAMFLAYSLTQYPLTHRSLVRDAAQRDHRLCMNDLATYLGCTSAHKHDYLLVEDAKFPGTCNWFTSRQSYVLWRDDATEQPPFFWISGQPAAGKSVLAGHIIRDLQSEHRNFSYFFFKHGDSTRSRMVDCMKSLAYQMADTHSQVRAFLEQMQNEGTLIDHEDERMLWQKLFIDGIFHLALPTHYWILDGLDECDNSSAFICTMIGKLNASIPLKMLFTSRNTPALHVAFAKLGRDNFRHEKLTNVDTLPDIQLFVEDRISIMESTGEQAKRELVQRIVAKSKGSFLWSVLVLDGLVHAHSQKRLHDMLENVPKGMESLYRRILEPMSQNLDDKHISRSILTWICCTNRPLLLDELEAAVVLDTKETFVDFGVTVKALCGQLITLDKLGRVLMVHETAREFLINGGPDLELSIDSRSAHTQIACTCLKVLIELNSRSSRSNRRTGNSSKVKSSLALYAHAEFSTHISMSSPPSAELFDLLTKFLQSTVLTWIEQVAQTFKLRNLLVTARHLNTYATMCGKDLRLVEAQLHFVKDWAVDLVRISAKFGHALIACPSTIHTTIPPFCPYQSAIYGITKATHRLVVSGLSRPMWDDRLCCIDFRNDRAFAVAHGDDYFAIGLSSGTIAIYHALTGQEHKQLKQPDPVSHIHFIDNILASSGGSAVRTWDVSTGACLRVFLLPRQCVNLTSDKHLLIAACRNNFTMSWQLDDSAGQGSSRQWCKASSVSRLQARAVSISPIHNVVAAAYPSQPVMLFDYEDNEYFGLCGKKDENGDLMKHPVSALVMNPNSALELLAISYLDGDLMVLNPFEDRCIKQFRANCSELASSPDGKLLAGAAGAGVINIYDFETLELLHTVRSNNLFIRQLAFSKDNLHLVDVRGSQCNVWELVALHKGMLEPLSHGHHNPADVVPSDSSTKITAMTLHPLQDYILCGRSDGVVLMCPTKHAATHTEVYRHKSSVRAVDWMPTLDAIISIDASNSLVVRQITLGGCEGLTLGAELLHGRLDSSHSVVQLFPSHHSHKFVLSTREADHLWTVDGGPKYRQDCSQQPGIRRWVHRNESPDIAMCVDATSIQVYSWNDWTKLAYISLDANLCSMLVKSVRPLIIAKQQKLLLELATQDSPYSTEALSLVDVEFSWEQETPHLSPQVDGGMPKPGDELDRACLDLPCYPVSSPAVELRALAQHVSHVISISSSGRLIFLDNQSWVCSVSVSELCKSNFTCTRHFFVPYEWFLGSRTTICLQVNGNLLFAYNAGIVTVRGGLGLSTSLTTIVA